MKGSFMKKAIDTLGKVVLISAFLSIAGLIYNMVFYIRLEPLVLAFDDIAGLLEKMQIPVAVIFIFLFLFNLLAVLYVFLQFIYFKRESFLRALVFFLAVMSALMVLGDFGLLSDIGKEHSYRLDTSTEWPVLYFSQGMHFLFVILLIVLIFWTFKKIKEKREEYVLKDEAIFINAQYIGIFCGLFGLAVFGALASFAALWAIKKGIFIVSFISLVPYILIVGYWLIIKIREKTGPWYDEKQYLDISRASLFTIVSSIVIMAVIFVLQYFFDAFGFIQILWFPFFFFSVLFLFSCSTLFFSKRSLS